MICGHSIGVKPVPSISHAHPTFERRFSRHGKNGRGRPRPVILSTSFAPIVAWVPSCAVNSIPSAKRWKRASARRSRLRAVFLSKLSIGTLTSGALTGAVFFGPILWTICQKPYGIDDHLPSTKPFLPARLALSPALLAHRQTCNRHSCVRSMFFHLIAHRHIAGSLRTKISLTPSLLSCPLLQHPLIHPKGNVSLSGTRSFDIPEGVFRHDISYSCVGNPCCRPS